MTLKVSKPIWALAQDETQSDQSVIVNSTLNYERFRFNPLNRSVDRKHVEELIVAIREKNLLKEFPIIVDRDFSIVDGQHRLLAAQSLRVPIYYIVSKEMTVDDVWNVNNKVDHWDTQDHMRTWSMRGNSNYIILDKFMKTYPFVPFAAARDLLSARGHKDNPTAAFRDGKFVANRIEFAEKTASVLLDFKRHTILYKHAPFIRAVMNLVANPLYQHSRMMQKLEYLSRMLKKCPDTKTYIALFSEIYNYRVKTSDIVELKQTLARSRGHRPDQEGQEK